MRLLMARLNRLARTDEGMATAEYAVGTVAACGFSSVLYKLLTSDSIGSLLSNVFQRALSSIFG